MKTRLSGPSWGGTSYTTSNGRHWPLLNSVILCLLAGLVIVLLDTFVRIPLHAPGWRGLVMVPVLIEANRMSGRPWGATGAAVAAAGFGLWLGDPVRFGPLAYVLPGVVADLALRATGRRLPSLVVTGVLVNLASLVTGLVHGGMMMQRGMGPMAWIGHAAFGAVAGLIVFLFEQGRRK